MTESKQDFLDRERHIRHYVNDRVHLGWFKEWYAEEDGRSTYLGNEVIEHPDREYVGHWGAKYEEPCAKLRKKFRHKMRPNAKTYTHMYPLQGRGK